MEGKGDIKVSAQKGGWGDGPTDPSHASTVWLGKKKRAKGWGHKKGGTNPAERLKEN